MDHTALWPSSKQFGCFAPSIPTIGPWEAAATGGILYLQRCQNISLWSSTMENLHISSSILSSQRRSTANRRKSRTVAFAVLPICHGKSEPKKTHLTIFEVPQVFSPYIFYLPSRLAKRWYIRCMKMCVITFVLYVYCVKTSCKADQWKLCK